MCKIDRYLRSLNIINSTLQMTDVEIENGAFVESTTLQQHNLIEPPQMLSTNYKINRCEDKIA